MKEDTVHTDRNTLLPPSLFRSLLALPADWAICVPGSVKQVAHDRRYDDGLRQPRTVLGAGRSTRCK